MKIVYQTDFEGFYTGPVEADPSPLEPGVWLIPGGAVVAKPPALADGQRARWNGGAWDVIEPPAAPLPAPEPLPEEIRAALHRQIDVERERRLIAGSAFHVPSPTLTPPVPLAGRPQDRTVHLELLVQAQGLKAAGVTDAVMRVRDNDNVVQMLTPDQMIALIAQAMQWFEQVMAVSWAMKDETGPFETGLPENWTDDEHWP
jgi:hypothetical protein